MAIATLTARKRLSDELERRFGLSEWQTDSEVRQRHVWRNAAGGADWMVLCSSRHFDFRKNILESVQQRGNSGYAVLCGLKADAWYVYMTDLVPLISKVLQRQERTADKQDGSTYYEVDFTITLNGELHLTAYPEIKFVEMSELSKAVNDG